MAKISGNFSFNPNPVCKAGDVFDDFNLTQLIPHTKVCTKVAGLIFRNGNIMNCDLPADSVSICQSIYMSFCSHLHPEWVALGLPVCPTECEHVTEKYPFEDKSVVQYTAYQYEDKVVV